MDHLTSAYSSYLPNQPPAGISGFGMNPMAANLPDYGIYGTEAAQRAAAMVSVHLFSKEKTKRNMGFKKNNQKKIFFFFSSILGLL
jgi:hypothetical protein